jgi:hypothetical protein
LASTIPVEMRKIAQLAFRHRRGGASVAIEIILAAYWKISTRAATTEEDACALRADSNVLGAQPKYWRPTMQYGKSREAIDRLTAARRRLIQEVGTERPFTVIGAAA